MSRSSSNPPDGDPAEVRTGAGHDDVEAIMAMPLVRYANLISDNARWDGFAFRAGDIVIATPPKCGTTWTQMLVGMLVFGGPEFPAPLAGISPWLDMCDRPIDEVLAELDAQTHRRFVKTHTPLDGVPFHRDVHYVVVGRDPRDVSISFEHHMANWDLLRFMEVRTEQVGFEGMPPLDVPPVIPDDPGERFRLFVTSESDVGMPTLATVLHHFSVGWARRHLPNVTMVHFGDLMADLPGELMRLGNALDRPVDAARAEQWAAAASLDAMRDRAPENAEHMAAVGWSDPKSFFRTGGVGEWEDRVTPELAALYEARVDELVDPTLATWAHGGWHALGTNHDARPTE